MRIFSLLMPFDEERWTELLADEDSLAGEVRLLEVVLVEEGAAAGATQGLSPPSTRGSSPAGYHSCQDATSSSSDSSGGAPGPVNAGPALPRPPFYLLYDLIFSY